MLFQYLIEVVGSQPFTQTDVEPDILIEKYYLFTLHKSPYMEIPDCRQNSILSFLFYQFYFLQFLLNICNRNLYSANF